MTIAMTQETPWRAGRLDAATGRSRLLFGRMYEDAEIERAAFEGHRRVFCIASAGATALQLSREHDVVACDVNPVQLAYAERRARGGPVETGDAERAMKAARAFMPLVGWNNEKVREFLSLADTAAQLAFWKERLDTRRFRIAFDALMSPGLLRIIYSPRLLSVLPANFGGVLRKRLERGFARHANSLNPYARALLTGEAGEDAAPNNPRIRFVLGEAAEFLESCPPRSFDAFALSNILDGTDAAYRSRLFSAVQHAASPGAVVVLRSFAEPLPELETNHAECDRSMLWGVVDVRRAQDLY